MLVEAVPNFSAGPGWAPAAPLTLDVSGDVDHNRTVVTLAGSPSSVGDSVFSLVAQAVETLDLRRHRGLHPRLGVADVVPFVPLWDASVASCAELARSFAARVWETLRVPCYLYGAAGRWTLREIRSSSPPPPDVGGPLAHPTAGFCCVGARDFLVAYNIVIDRGSSQNVRSLAASLRATSASGLAGVQALAFALPSGAEQLSMNLVDLSVVRPALVRAEVERRGFEVSSDEVVGLCPALAAADAPAAAGRLLEARLAASALARAASGAVGGDPIAPRLANRAAALAELGVEPEAWLAAAEESAAAARILVALGFADEEVIEMLRCASARLLEAAVAHSDVEARLPERVAALRRLLPA